MYHLKVVSLKVPGRSLHFKCSSTPMIEEALEYPTELEPMVARLLVRRLLTR
ncbi:hypothetical protein A2U01_0071000, partial [Trifolium medium]|nr:hypothetical protein [Trifolium medium]